MKKCLAQTAESFRPITMIQKEWFTKSIEFIITTVLGAVITAAIGVAMIDAPWLSTPLGIAVSLIAIVAILLLWNLLKKRRMVMTDKVPPSKSVGIRIEGGSNNRATGNRFEGLDEAISVKDSHGNTFDKNLFIHPTNNQQRENDDENHQTDK